MDPLISILTGFGVPGVVIAVLLVVLRKKDQDLTDERAARLADAKANQAFALEMQGRTLSGVEKNAEVAEVVSRALDELRRTRR